MKYFLDDDGCPRDDELVAVFVLNGHRDDAVDRADHDALRTPRPGDDIGCILSDSVRREEEEREERQAALAHNLD